jgi:probable HAF family extracellular repeat protein
MHDIGFLGTNKNDQSYAYAINASGVVVGQSEIDPTTGTTHAFLFNGQIA